MDLLLDTHALIWFFESDIQLSPIAKAAIENPLNRNYLSVASIWEIAIKQSIGKLSLSKPTHQVISHLQNSGITFIPIETNHVLGVETLPLHHRDHFDRLIISQSLFLDFHLVSKDTIFDSYGVKRIW